jgi:TIR domain
VKSFNEDGEFKKLIKMVQGFRSQNIKLSELIALMELLQNLAFAHKISELQLISDAYFQEQPISFQFDVFLCHNSHDKPKVKEIGRQLKERGIRPWLDEWNLQPGLPAQPLLESYIKDCRSVAVFVGKNSLGPWQDEEIQATLQWTIREKKPVIPVILPDCVAVPEFPLLLTNRTWVDFRKTDPDPLAQLMWGISGNPPET